MKERNIICKFYLQKDKCLKNKGCSVNKEMQHCGLYEPNLNSKPFRYNNKQKKIEQIKRKEVY